MFSTKSNQSRGSKAPPSFQGYADGTQLDAMLLVLVTSDEEGSTGVDYMPSVRTTIVGDSQTTRAQLWKSEFTARAKPGKGLKHHNKVISNRETALEKWCQEASNIAQKTKPDGQSTLGYHIVTTEEQFHRLAQGSTTASAADMEQGSPSEQESEATYAGMQREPGDEDDDLEPLLRAT